MLGSIHRIQHPGKEIIVEHTGRWPPKIALQLLDGGARSRAEIAV